MRRAIVAIGATVAFAACATSARADPVVDFYRGRTVTLVIGYSAAGGYDIPGGVNPIVQTHAREMILPASLADPMRNMLAGGGGGGHTLNFNISANDGASVRKMLIDNKSTIHQALKMHLRGTGSLVPTYT